MVFSTGCKALFLSHDSSNLGGIVSLSAGFRIRVERIPTVPAIPLHPVWGETHSKYYLRAARIPSLLYNPRRVSERLFNHDTGNVYKCRQYPWNFSLPRNLDLSISFACSGLVSVAHRHQPVFILLNASVQWHLTQPYDFTSFPSQYLLPAIM